MYRQNVQIYIVGADVFIIYDNGFVNENKTIQYLHTCR